MKTRHFKSNEVCGMKKFNPFEIRTDLANCTYPIVKIIICLSILTTIFFRDRIYCFTNECTDEVVTIIVGALSVVIIFFIYVSIAEICGTFWKRNESKKQPTKPTNITNLSIEKVIGIVSENDIIEIEVYADKKVIKIGASADCKYSSSVFEDKLFYIADSEYDTIGLFSDALRILFSDGNIPVSRIDGLPLKYYTGKQR